MQALPLSDVITFAKGKTVKTSDAQSPGFDVPYLTIDAMEGGKPQFAPSSSVITKGNDVLVVADGSRSGLVFYGKQGAVASTVLRVSTQEKKLRAKYLYYLSQHLKWNSPKYKKGSTVPHFDYAKAASDIVELPKPPEQDKIVYILSVLDKSIQTTQKIIHENERLKKAMMQELFSADMNWSIYPLSEVATIQTGIAKNSNLRGDDVIEMPYLRVANVLDGRLDLSEIKHIKVRKADIDRYMLRKGDLLLTEGGDRDKLGRGFLWHGEIDNCLHQNHVFAVRPDKAKLNSMYLAYLAQSSYGKKYFLSVASQTTNLASINSTKLKNFPVMLPSLEKQREISGILSAVDKKIAINKEFRAKQLELKKGLMQDLLTGKVQV